MASNEQVMRDRTIKYTSGFKYQIAEDFTIQTGIKPEIPARWLFVELEPSGWLKIKKGFASDGPSGKITIHTKSSMVAAFVHDALYCLMKRELLSRKYKEAADLLFYRLLLEDGMWKWRADLWYDAVREFGCDALKAPEKVKEAP